MNFILFLNLADFDDTYYLFSYLCSFFLIICSNFIGDIVKVSLEIFKAYLTIMI